MMLLSTEMLLKKCLSAAISKLGRLLVVMFSADPGKSVIHSWIDIRANQGIAFYRRYDLSLGFLWNKLVFFGNVVH